MPSQTTPFFSRPRHSTAVQRGPVGYLLSFGFFGLPREVPRSCYQTHTNLRRRWPVWNQTPFAWTRKSVVAAHYKKDNLLHCWTKQFGYFRLPCGHSRRTRHCRSRAGARHSMCELTHGMAEERHGRGMGTTCYVWIGLSSTSLQIL